MNLQPQTVYVPVDESKPFKMGANYTHINGILFEKREGVIVLTPERFKQIVGDVITDVILKSNNLPFDNYINWKKEYLNQLIQP